MCEERTRPQRTSWPPNNRMNATACAVTRRTPRLMRSVGRTSRRPTLMVVRGWLDKTLLAELLLALLLVGYGWFSVYRLVLLLLLASQSLWIRSLGWSDLGLARPRSLWRVVVQGVAGAGIILLAVRFFIVPIAEKLTGVAVDLSQVEAIRGDPETFRVWLAQALTLAAFGEELVFRGYLIHRVA